MTADVSSASSESLSTLVASPIYRMINLCRDGLRCVKVGMPPLSQCKGVVSDLSRCRAFTSLISISLIYDFLGSQLKL